MNDAAQFQGTLRSGRCAGQTVEGDSIAQQDPQLPGIQGEGQRDGNAEIFGVSAERPQSRFDGDGVAWMGGRLGCRGSLQLDAAPAGKGVDIQVDALDIAYT